MDNQDWTEVTVKRTNKNKNSQANQNNQTIRPKLNNSEQVAVAKKLETSDIGKPKQLTSESRNEIIQKRVALGKTQVQLNQDCRFPVNTIREIESGRFCPSIQQVSMINRSLKASLKFAS